MRFIKNVFYSIKKYFLKKIKIKIINIFLFNKCKFQSSSIKKILLLNYSKKLDNIVIATPLIEKINKNGFIIDLLINKKNFSLIKYNPWINKIILYNKIKRNDIAKKIKKNLYDLIIDVEKITFLKHFLFLKKIIYSNAIGFNKKEYKIYNISIKYNKNKHIFYKYQNIMKYLGIKDININYDIFIPDKTKKFVNNFFISLPGRKKILINPFHINQKKSMSVLQINNLIYLLKKTWPDCDFILNNFCFFNKNNFSELYIQMHFKDIYSILEIIKKSDLIISTNNLIAHIAQTFCKPIVKILAKKKYHYISEIKILEIILAVKKMNIL